jgi:hypothetical protein
MQCIFQISPSRFESIIGLAGLLVLPVENYFLLNHYILIVFQWLALVITLVIYYKIPSNKVILLQRAGDNWCVTYSNGLTVQFQIGQLSQNRKYWVKLSGKVIAISKSQYANYVDILRITTWHCLGYRITIFIDSVDRQDWHTLKHHIWAL